MKELHLLKSFIRHLKIWFCIEWKNRIYILFDVRINSLEKIYKNIYGMHEREVRGVAFRLRWNLKKAEAKLWSDEQKTHQAAIRDKAAGQVEIQ